MLKSILVATFVLLAVFVSTALGANAQSAETSGPQLSLSASGSTVSVSATTTSPSPYVGYRLHLTWNPTILRLSPASVNPGNKMIGDPTCETPLLDVADAGVTFICRSTSGLSSAKPQALASFTFSSATSIPGCSRVHLSTFGPPDFDGFADKGSDTFDAATAATQSNTYDVVDVLLPVNGGSCAVVAANPGPRLEIAASGLKVTFLATTPSPRRYAGYQLHLTWDKQLLALDPGAAVANELPGPPGNPGPTCSASADDGSGAGVVFACDEQSGAPDFAEQFASVSLHALNANAGCASIRLVQFAEPDGGGTAGGSFTVDPSTLARQENSYGVTELHVPVGGASCPPSTANTVDPVALLQQGINSLNRGDVTGVLATYDDHASFQGAGPLCVVSLCIGTAAIQAELDILVAAKMQFMLSDVLGAGATASARFEAAGDYTKTAGVTRVVGAMSLELAGTKVSSFAVTLDRSDPQTAAYLNFYDGLQQPQSPTSAATLPSTGIASNGRDETPIGRGELVALVAGSSLAATGWLLRRRPISKDGLSAV